MFTAQRVTPHAAVMVPALHEIQQTHGYLEPAALTKLASDLDLPLYRIQGVASFFPHFRLQPPRRVTLRICRDMACHLAGSAGIINELHNTCGNDVSIEGVSCLGRCDRAPAACVGTRESSHDLYFLGRNAAGLKKIIDECLAGLTSEQTPDTDREATAPQWLIDPYVASNNALPDYRGALKAIALRNDSLQASLDRLASEFKWPLSRLERFRLAALGGLPPDQHTEAELKNAVLDWQTEAGWAVGETYGGWSDLILQELTKADLRGMGGAGIPHAQKLRDVRDAVRTARHRGIDDRAYIVVNGDESEPGTFKDREILLRAPHIVVEGVILAALVTEAREGIIFIRHEYPEQIEACRAEIARAETLGLCGANPSVVGRPLHISVFASPGGYICGEQSALIEAMSDRRGEPRNMPPKLETNGLNDLPTIVSNVETYAWIPSIWINGGAHYADLGANGWKGRRLFSVSGDVKRPGVYEVPMGMTLRELILGNEYCQGMIDDRPLKALAPSGPSGGFLPAKLTPSRGLPREHVKNKAWLELAARRGFDPAANELDILDLELELNLFRSLSPTQALGAGLVVYAEGRDMIDQAVNSLEFYRNESCGKCVPCRVGSQKMVSVGSRLLDGKISATEWENDLQPLISELGKAIELSSICGLGRSVPVPLRCAVNFFEDDLRAHLQSASSNMKERAK